VHENFFIKMMGKAKAKAQVQSSNSPLRITTHANGLAAQVVANKDGLQGVMGSNPHKHKNKICELDSHHSLSEKEKEKRE
jgi:hypothetical protein